ncbi:MAG: metal ABC transporter permease [Ruminococcaceae bacterium]|nr:metal ABC transporter permease [Oscillospiraceae bacterium]
METIVQIFSYTFMTRAFIVGALVSLCAALLGLPLVLKKYSMIGDGLSHVGFGALAVATVMNAAPMKVAIPVVIIAAIILLRINENSKLKGDAAIAIISTGALALGVVIMSLGNGSNIDIYNYMFGSILALGKSDVYISIILSIIVIILYIFFYVKIFAVTFDENFSKATGIRTGLYNMLTAVLTALTIVLGMRLMGSLLISALIIFPALSSMRIFRSFKATVISSAILSVVCFCIGLTMSFLYSMPPGASVVCVNIAGFIIYSIAGKLRAVLFRLRKNRQQR